MYMRNLNNKKNHGNMLSVMIKNIISKLWWKVNEEMYKSLLKKAMPTLHEYMQLDGVARKERKALFGVIPYPVEELDELMYLRDNYIRTKCRAFDDIRLKRNITSLLKDLDLDISVLNLEEEHKILLKTEARRRKISCY